MKCIEYKADRFIDRVDNEDAHAAVRKGHASYVSKDAWRAQLKKFESELNKDA